MSRARYGRITHNMHSGGEPAAGRASAASTTPMRPRLPEVHRSAPKLGSPTKHPEAAQSTPSPSCTEPAEKCRYLPGTRRVAFPAGRFQVSKLPRFRAACPLGRLTARLGAAAAPFALGVLSKQQYSSNIHSSHGIVCTYLKQMCHKTTAHLHIY